VSCCNATLIDSRQPLVESSSVSVMSREATSEAQERQQREREAAAFLTSLGPQFEKAGAGKRVGGGAVSSQRAQASNGAPQAAKTISSAVTVSLQESEEKRQQALRRLKFSTHRTQ